jgi:hypothetical protein
MTGPRTPAWLTAWADENDYILTDQRDSTYKVACARCGPIRGMRDVPLEIVEEYAREHPANPCPGMAEMPPGVVHIWQWERRGTP